VNTSALTQERADISVALQEFILLAAQKESGGGLRDKPGKYV